MKNFVIVASIALALSACSTTKKVDLDPVSNETTKYVQDFGKVEVTFTDDGQWTQIKSSATSAVPIREDLGLEQAMNVATMRAKRNIVEFINTDLKSSKTTDTITKALAKNVSEDDATTKQRAANIATDITEKIAVEANGILKGVYVIERKVSSDKSSVVVVVQVDKRSMRAAQQLRASFGSN
jgi:hypothetical protein